MVGLLHGHEAPARAHKADGAAFRRAAALDGREPWVVGGALRWRYVNSKKTDSPTADGFSAPSTRMSKPRSSSRPPWASSSAFSVSVPRTVLPTGTGAGNLSLFSP